MENPSTEELVLLLKNIFPDLKTYFHRDLINQDVYLFSISVRNKQNYISAAGMDIDSETAKRKAISEFIERVAFFEQNPIVFNGFAAHPDQEEAKENSIKELIERDHFLTSWLIKRAPTYLSEKQVMDLVSTQYQNIYSNTSSSNFEQSFGIIGSQDKYITTCAILKNDRDRFILATATETSLVNCLEKLILDMRRSANISISYSEDLSKEFNHINYYLSDKCKENVEWFLAPKENSSEVLVFPDYEISTKLYEPIQLESIPIHTAISSSNDSQLYFHGETKKSKINLDKFSTCYELGFEDLNLQTHPLG